MHRSRIHGLAAAAIGMAGMLGCSTISAPPSLPEDAKVKATAEPANAQAADPYLGFNRALAAAQAASAPASARMTLLEEGFGLIEYRCARYFTVLGHAEQDLRYNRKETSLTSGVVLGMLGLANQTPKAIANTGSLFSFASASMDSYEDVYIFSPDVKAVQSLVMDALAAWREKFEQDLAPNADIPLSSVWNNLAQYESYCQPHGIRNLVNKSLGQVQTVASPTPAAAPAPATGASAASNAASAPARAASASRPAASAPVAAAAPAASAASVPSVKFRQPRVTVEVIPRERQ